MMKLLSPAGDMDSLIMAVFNGADEVYLGVKDFNARNIEGFNLTTLKQAVDFAHIFGVKVHLTVNILFFNDEIQQALNLIIEAYNLGVDAFIIQDVGLASIVHSLYPQIEMHASTQMGIHNLEGVRFVENLGFKRVVLSRETELEEIERIHKNSNIEIEYFVQGALCVSFSGNCYISSYLNNASGNRGKCKQFCRLPYTLEYNTKPIKSGYLLSAKDFCMLNRLKDLKTAGVTSVKIEGRARRPFYVGMATKVYRQALDGKPANEKDLELAFNRGYAEGYFNGNGGIISNTQNHIGVCVGEVKKVNVGKRFNEIFISSNREINPKSTLKFFIGKDETTLTAYDISKKGELYRITTTQMVKEGSKVHLIVDAGLEEKMLSTKKKRKINLQITAKENCNIEAKLIAGGQTLTIKGDVLERAKSSPLTIEELQNNFKKTEFLEFDINADLGQVFIPKQKLNKFRRKVVEETINLLTKTNRQKLEKVDLKNNNKFLKPTEKLSDFCLINSVNQNFNAKNVIFAPSEYNLEEILEFKALCKKQNKIAILNTPIYATKLDIELLSKIIDKTHLPILVNNYYALNFNTDKFIGAGLNICNNYTASYFNLPYLTAENEMTFKMPYMTLRHCPMKEFCASTCANCKYKAGYTYKMQNGKRLKLTRTKLNSCTFYLTD